MPRETMPVDQIVSILRETPERLALASADLSDARLHASPEPGEWSMTELLAHLRSCADVWGTAIETISSTAHPVLRAVSPITWVRSTDYGELAFSPSLESFRSQRDDLLGLLEALSAADWSRSGTVLGAGKPLELTVLSYANRMARHERTHWRQAGKTARALAL
ncbi:MAG TPA: DinB family protein [Acidimicrobiales bacterium]|nr:DinB family protein [Acidimicrobiales bacterium]